MFGLMPRKRKTQKQDGTTNEHGADLLPPTVNTSKPSTRLAQKERATPEKRSDGPAIENQRTVKQHREQVPALVSNELNHGASLIGKRHDSETGVKGKSGRTGDNHAPVERSPSSSLSATNSRPKPSTWASLVSGREPESTALDMRVDKNSKDIKHQIDTKSFIRNDSNSIETEMIRTFRELENKRKARAQDKAIKLQSLKDFSKSFSLPTPVPRDLLPILARDRLKQDQILARMKLATNFEEAAKPSNEEKASGTLQHLQEDASVEKQESCSSSSSEAMEDGTLSNALEDGQIESSNPTQDDHDPRSKFGEIPYDSPSFTARSVVFPDETLRDDSPSIAPIPSLWSSTFVRSPDTVGPQLTSNGTRQESFDGLLNPPMMAFECGLREIRHHTFPRGTLDPFQTLRNLGRGSMAHVEEVHIPSYRPFVRKTFLLTMSSDLRLPCRDIIHREIQVMSRLAHMHIVKVIGSYDLEPITSTILMFPVGDNDLKMFFDEVSKIPPGTHEWDRRRSWLWKWVGCLTSAIAYIHSQGICHKDIKPSNIVHKGGNVYLTDFSSCGQFDIGGTTSTGADARTTLMYRAPELFRTGDAGKHGPGTDIFALGLVFLEMKTVYSGTSIQRLRELYAAAASVKSANITEFYYRKALTHIHEELRGSTHQGDNEAWPLTSAVVLSMLASERKERPSAVQVLDAIHSTSTNSCVCVMPNASSDNRFSDSEHHQDIMSQVSDPSAIADPFTLGVYVKPSPLRP